MTDEAKPAASLTAAKIRRSVPPDQAAAASVPVTAPVAAHAPAPKPVPAKASAPPNVAATVPPPVSASEPANVRQLVASARDVAGRHTSEPRSQISVPNITSGLLTWRRAGLFGLVYFGALLFFAAAFDVWPLVLG